MRPSGAHSRGDDGFGLIELIVVIGMLAILAAIAIPSFVALRAGVQEAATRSDLGSDRTAIVGFTIDNNGVIPAASGFNPRASGLDLVAYGWIQSPDSVSYRYSTNSAATAWCLDMTSVTGRVFRVSTANTSVGVGTCAALGAASF